MEEEINGGGGGLEWGVGVGVKKRDRKKKKRGSRSVQYHDPTIDHPPHCEVN